MNESENRHIGRPHLYGKKYALTCRITFRIPVAIKELIVAHVGKARGAEGDFVRHAVVEKLLREKMLTDKETDNDS